MNLHPESLSWLACVLSNAGALLLSLNVRYSRWGFAVFLVSNIFWVKVGIDAIGTDTHAPAMIANQLFLMGTSMIGVWRWLIINRQ